MPDFWWSGACKRTNGYFGCEDTYGDDDDDHDNEKSNGHSKLVPE
jgi:hypothetical protein